MVDEFGGYVWASAAGLSEGNFIVRFKPETFTAPGDTSCDHDFSEAPPVGYCTGLAEDRCFQRYDLPSLRSVPARMLLGAQGELWVAEFFGGRVARLDPATGTFTEFPLPDASGPSFQSALLGPGPWDLLLDGNGDLLISEGFDSEIVQFDPSAGEVVAEYGIPSIDREVEFLHSMSADASGSVWFGVYATDEHRGHGRVGRLTLSGEIQMFPPLTQLGIAGGASGVRVSPSGEVWAALLWEKGVGRFVRY
jgi:streptogramin lyase